MTASYFPAGFRDTLAASRLRIEVAESDPDVEIGVGLGIHLGYGRDLTGYLFP